MTIVTRSVRAAVWLLVAGFAWLAIGGAQAQEGRRLALLIGNADYRYSGPLNMTTNDANDMGAALHGLGFEVTVVLDATNVQMQKAIRDFAATVQGADAALVFYSGHGMEIDGINYLIPVNAKLRNENDLETQFVSLNDMMRQVEGGGARFNMFILDACRNNPFEEPTRSLFGSAAGSGLAAVEPATGTLIVYATSPGKYSWEGIGSDRNSTFTHTLLQVIQEPGIEVSMLLRHVREQVASMTEGEQVPWDASAFIGQFYFSPPEGVTMVSSNEQGNWITGQPGGGGASVATLGPAMISDLLSSMQLSSEVFRDSTGTLALAVDSSNLPGEDFQVLFYDCDAEDQCQDIRLWAWFEQAGPADPNVANQWNYERRWTRAYVDQDRDAVLAMDINATGGVGAEQVAQMIGIYVEELASFEQAIGN